MTPAYETGREILGPLIARFARDLRLHAGATGPEDQVALLFCARGGIRMRIAYETAVQALGIGVGGQVSDLMVSRLMAAKTGLGSVPYAAEIFVRECEDRSVSQAAKLLLPSDLAHLADGNELEAKGLDVPAILALLARQDALGHAIRRELGFQQEAFADHLHGATGGRKNAILVDTGLYGGTMRLLEEVHPEYDWSCALIGRANYRGTPAPHFARTVGLVFEADRPLRHMPASAILRHWHLIEGMFEPLLRSVVRFDRDAHGRPVSNLEVPGWQTVAAARGQEIFDGAIDHLSSLRPTDLVHLDKEARRAARELSRMILRPTSRDVEALDIAPRSWDFGRDGASLVLRPVEGLSLSARIWSVRHALWREGQIRRALPLPSLALRLFAVGRLVSDLAPSAKRSAKRIRNRVRMYARIAREGTARPDQGHVVNPSRPH